MSDNSPKPSFLWEMTERIFNTQCNQKERLLDFIRRSSVETRKKDGMKTDLIASELPTERSFLRVLTAWDHNPELSLAEFLISPNSTTVMYCTLNVPSFRLIIPFFLPSKRP
jgi:hypothetical protein